jgi:catechol 2,3-dioxygenase-like lactoylglutathione lyase family enzyme
MVPDLGKAEKFYSGVMGLILLSKTDKQLVYNMIHSTLFVEKSEEAKPPVPSFTVDSLIGAKKKLLGAGCEIVKEGKDWMWFKDPFGNIFDVIEQ